MKGARVGVPTAERPPKGLDAHHLGVWRHALKTLKALELWTWELAPLLGEYVHALQAADRARLADEPTQWDRHAKRAAALADQLALTPRGRKAIALASDDPEDAGPADPFAALDTDELAPRRAKRAGA